MSVYTQLDQNDISAILTEYSLGTLVSFSGISAGIENSNFFVNTSSGRYVLTLFERMSADELPYFMDLMQHLSSKGFACPAVQLRHDGSTLLTFVDADGVAHHGCIVSCIAGEVLPALNLVQLHSAGVALAKLHLAGSDFAHHRDSPSGMDWLQAHVHDVAEGVNTQYGTAIVQQLQAELKQQQQCDYQHLPQGLIHGDYFCDNILFAGEQVSGVIDFYYGHDAPYALDLAIALNALSIDHLEVDEARPAAVLAGYQSVRQLSDAEWGALPDLLALAAMRFWLSRLYDSFFPREGEMTTTLEPEEYRLKLQYHRQQPQLVSRLRHPLLSSRGTDDAI